MIPFVDLKSQFKAIERDLRSRIDAVLEHGQFILGPEVKELEQKLAAFAGTKHCISCASGTDALFMALLAKGVGQGHVVFTTPFTFFATAETIALVNATPIFVDIDPLTFNMDPKALARAVDAFNKRDPSIHPLPATVTKGSSHKLAGVMGVDIFGLPSDYDAIHAVASEHGMWVMEDAAQSFGGEYKGKRAGALAEIACTSFFPAKPLGCYGDGGAIFTNDDKLTETLVSIRVHGQGSDRYEHVRLGVTGRLDSMQAAVLLAKLPPFENELKERQRVADGYSTMIKRAVPDLATPTVPAGYRSAWAQYCVLAKDSAHRTRLRDKLQAGGVPTAVYYPIPLHQQKVFAELGYKPGSMPVSDDFATRIFALPMHPYVTNAMIEEIVGKLKSA